MNKFLMIFLISFLISFNILYLFTNIKNDRCNNIEIEIIIEEEYPNENN